MEILFKAKRKDTGEWVEGYAFPSIAGHELNRITVFESYYYGTVVNTYQTDPETVCLFTGIYDRKGKKIFELDKVYDPHENKEFFVAWNQEYAKFVLRDVKTLEEKNIERAFYCEVIGNMCDKENKND